MNAELLERLRALEIPDCACNHFRGCPGDGPCDCPIHLAPPCKHVRAADHTVTIESWATLLVILEPTEYTQPARPSAPALALSREHRIEIMAERHELGLSLWHPGDSWIDLPDHLANEGSRLRNGSAVEGEVFVETSEEDEPDILPWEEPQPYERRLKVA